MFVLDTNTVIYYFKGLGKVAQNFLMHSPQEISIPAIVLYELGVGVEKSIQPQKRQVQLNHLIQNLVILPFDQKAAKIAAVLRAKLEKKGASIGPLDTLIAATALAFQATLVTHNTREFSKVPGLQLVDWF